MVYGFNIGLLLGLIIPPIMFALIVYLTSPYKSINLKRGFHHIGVGITSILLVTVFNTVFPNWSESSVEFFNTFFIIAPKEELSKLLMFVFMGTMVTRAKEHPIATMFYMSMVGLGFAMYENVQYVLAYGEEVLGIRLFTATVAHMLFGMFMGYWMAKGNIENGRGNRSVFGVLMSKRLDLKRYVYVMIGLCSAIGYHGLWNYNLMLSSLCYGNGYSDVSASPIMIMMIFFGLIGAMFASKDLNDSYKRSLKIKPKKPLIEPKV
jgi:RsiW-degrading membrane proteinase PrsW (M82 family)